MSDWLEIHALADEQLTAEEKARVQERLASCERSRKELSAIESVKSVAASRRDAITCDETWKRCQKRLDELEKTHRIEGFIGKYAWAMCSLFLVCIIGAGLLNRGRGSFGAAEVPRMAANLTPFMSSPKSQEATTQQRFIEQTAGTAPVQIRSQGQIYLLRGAGIERNGKRMVQFDLRDSQGDVSLYAFEDEPVEGVDPVPGRERFSFAQVNDTNIVSWRMGNYSMILQGNRSVDGLCDFAELVCQR